MKIAALVQMCVVSGVLLGGVAVPAEELPRVVMQDGRASLFVDGKPYWVLGAQVDNSSGWPERLEAVWPAAEKMRLNTLEVPVYWEQMEPARGTFEFGVVDALLAQARAHHVRLVMLWFGSWKNGKSHYVPDWVKADTASYPRMKTKGGVALDVLSPNAAANLEADKAAFRALMRHLKEVDAQHTVVMMQVENEAGSLGSVRDFGPDGAKAFAAGVPETLARGLGKKAGSWAEVFGDDSDEAFAAWSIARYIEQVAAVGNEELGLPMYVNNWLKSPRAYPVSTVPGEDYPSGGPTVNMHAVWKIAAPSLALLAPDIYVPNSERYQGVMREFHTAKNPLFIPESLGFEPFPGASSYARYLYYALGEGAIGFANFGLDRVKLEAPDLETVAEMEGFRLLGGFDRELARLAFAGKVKTAVEENGIAQREISFGGTGSRATRVVVSFPPAYDPPPSTVNAESGTTGLKEGRVVVAALGADEFLVAGIDCRVQFAAAIHSSKQVQMLKVEEGRYDGETWVRLRLWNGDETDNGLNFGGKGSLLRVKIGSY